MKKDFNFTYDRISKLIIFNFITHLFMKHNLQNALSGFFLAAALLISLGSQVNGQNITTVAGSGTPPDNSGYLGNGGQATAAELNGPAGIAIDDTGNLYIADLYNSVIRKINTSGIITTVVGTGIPGYSGDNHAATSAEIADPTGVFVDASGNIYIADYQNNRIRKVTAATGIITTLAGYGSAPYNAGYSGDGGTATLAELNGPYDVVADNSGDVYFSDYDNNRIREISGGIINTIAGTGVAGYSGDGSQAISAQLTGPEGIALDDSGNLYIADQGNNCIRKVSAATGNITTVAGNGSPGWSGDGGAAASAELQRPTGVIVDAAGNLYIADNNNYRIRLVSNGTINTIAGSGAQGYSGDGELAVLAKLNNPNDVVVDTAGHVYVADFGNNRIRELSGCGFTVDLNANSQTICSDSTVTLTASGGTSYTWSPATGLSATTGSSVTANPQANVTYTVTSSGSGGCQGGGIDAITVINSPNKPSITANGDTLISSATQANQWYRNDTIIPGATAQTYIYTIVGNYTVEAKNLVNGCSAVSNLFNPSTGINQLSINKDLLSIYPNPASGEIVVNISSSVADVKNWNLQITDVLGRTVYARSSLNYNNAIDLSNLAVGMYFITVTDKTARAVFPVVRQN
jgi:trimeric autotransporter adhesin